LLGWVVILKNRWLNFCFHVFCCSDEVCALHDHSWRKCSIVVSGEYLEHKREGVCHRGAGSIVFRRAPSLHRIELIDGKPARTIFLTGRWVRVWGFRCPNGWVPWREFDKKGCGE